MNKKIRGSFVIFFGFIFFIAGIITLSASLNVKTEQGSLEQNLMGVPIVLGLASFIAGIILIIWGILLIFGNI